MNREDAVRMPCVAGQFYPGSPEKLQATVQKYMSSGAAREQAGKVRALIVPHAGYPFSGATAGRTFALVNEPENFSRVAVVAPSHRVPFKGVSVGNFASYRTPIGDMRVDREMCDTLCEHNSLITSSDEPHYYEHALEVQLPFVQSIFSDVALLPLLCGQSSTDDMASIAESVLACNAFDEETLWVVSSDFTHYGPSFGFQPFTDNVPERLKELDGGAIEHIQHISPEKFVSYVERTSATICGAKPITLLLQILAKSETSFNCREVEYTTSGEITGDYSNSVTYAGLVFTEKEQGDSCCETEPDAAAYSKEEKQELLRLARDAIETRFADTDPIIPEFLKNSEMCAEKTATFVTLHEKGKLRGCIGELEPSRPLYDSVVHNARSAAFQDPRFQPLVQKELNEIDIEISILTPSKPIASLDEFVVGKHGIILEKGPHKAVFLPQVAVEQGWDTETTAQHLAMKAGLRPDDWRSGVNFYVFEAVVFGEKDIG